MKNRIVSTLALSLVLFSAMLSTKVAAQKHLDFMIMIEDGGQEYPMFLNDQLPPVLSQFILGGEQKIFMITHPGLLAMVMGITQDKHKDNKQFERLSKLKEDFKKNWEVKINKTRDWVVLNPKNSPAGKDLVTLGFNMGQLDDAWTQEEKLIAGLEKKELKEVSIDNFEKLFKPDTKLSKRIYLIGHGSPAFGSQARIADLTRDQYGQLIKFLNPTTDFLFIISCFAGGFNSVAFHQEEIKEGVIAKLVINFPIVLGSTTDAKVSIEGAPVNFNKFFQSLDQYLAKPNTSNLKIALSEILEGRGINITGTPLIRFPGAADFFRAVQIDKEIKILTMVGMKTYALDLKNKEKDGTLKPFSFEKDQILLLYPALVTIPIKYTKGGIIQKGSILSMVPGNAIHKIDNLIIPVDIDLKLIANILLPWELGPWGYPLIAIKTFLIKEIQYNNNMVLKNVIMMMETRGVDVTGKIIQDYKIIAQVPDSLKKPGVTGPLILMDSNKIPLDSNKIPWEISFEISFENWLDYPKKYGIQNIDPIKAKELAEKYIKMAMPNKEALNQATAGMQTMPMLEEAIKEFLNSFTKTEIPK